MLLDTHCFATPVFTLATWHCQVAGWKYCCNYTLCSNFFREELMRTRQGETICLGIWIRPASTVFPPAGGGRNAGGFRTGIQNSFFAAGFRVLQKQKTNRYFLLCNMSRRIQIGSCVCPTHPYSHNIIFTPQFVIFKFSSIIIASMRC